MISYYINGSGKLIEKLGADYRLSIGKLSQEEFDTYRVATDEEVEAILNPPKSTDELFTEEMVSLNAEYDKNMAILANKYNVAVARDGSSETAKVASARAEIAALDEQYDIDQLAIFNKYYGD